MDFSSLDIKVTDQMTSIKGDETYIFFDINEFRYMLSVRKNEETNTFSPQQVDHKGPFVDLPHQRTTCSICPPYMTHCRLNQYKHELFHALIEQPIIRLEWMFRDYE